MIELKRRLLETEAQMARILEAMEAVQQKVGSTVAAASEALVKEVSDPWCHASSKSMTCLCSIFLLF